MCVEGTNQSMKLFDGGGMALVYRIRTGGGGGRCGMKREAGLETWFLSVSRFACDGTNVTVNVTPPPQQQQQQQRNLPDVRGR